MVALIKNVTNKYGPGMSCILRIHHEFGCCQCDLGSEQAFSVGLA